MSALSRRRAVQALLSLATLPSARADDGTPPPVLFVNHGSPLFLPDQEPRRAALRRWGATIAAPRGIVVMTPHFASRGLMLGRSDAGFAMYNLPRGLKARLPDDLDYASPPSHSLAARVDALLGPGLARPERRGFDHSTWMPLKCLFPAASVPVVELGYPYVTPTAAFALGRKLAPLRADGVVFVASGGLTHNLAAAHDATPATWATEFDEWASDRLSKLAVDHLIDFRARAPFAELAHPDDGGHFRVLLVALGVALGGASGASVRFPVVGFDGGQSNRCVELR